MTVQTDRLPLLDTLELKAGGHSSIARGACLLEAASYVAGETWSDRPKCVSPILGTYGRSLNDVLPDDRRQLLKPFVPRLIGTAGDPAADQVRGLMAADWLLRTYTPTWLRLAGLVEDADALEALPRQASWDDVQAAVPVVQKAKLSATAAGDAARDAAGDAARDAAGDAAWDAAWDAAGDAAWDAAWDAARDAARDAAWDAARDAAWDAARDAARDAAWDAARDAAGDAAWDALRPTVERLQGSAIDLFDRMIAAAA